MIHTTIKQYLKLSILLVVLFFTACHSSRNLETRETDAAYRILRIEKGRKDNTQLYREAASWMGTPHRDGGFTRKGIDCSGLVWMIYKKVYNQNLSRISRDILQKNCTQVSKRHLREGDLVFFNTASGRSSISNINHVGIYLKDNKFIHASTSRGVMVSDLDEPFFIKAWVCGGRVKG